MTSDPIRLPSDGPFSLLILGGARSGKSRYGEDLVRSAKGRAVYIATAEARDDEMSARISHHQKQRGDNWHLIEEPLALADVLRERVSAGDVVLVDCLTLWLGNLMEKNVPIAAAIDDLIDALGACPAQVVLVSNEIGWGIVPDNAMARLFRDEAGRLHQQLSAKVDGVIAVIAGLPLTLKEPSQIR
jgi:adenosylcobinamide kinase / adenosylcobinamide-phosphate guanylyltransferase